MELACKMLKVIIFCICIGEAIGQDYLRTYPLRGGSSPSAEERYLKPQPLVLNDWAGNYRDNDPAVFWPFEKAQSPRILSNSESTFILPKPYQQQPDTLLTPLKASFADSNYPTNNYQAELESPFPANVIRNQPFSRRLQSTLPSIRGSDLSNYGAIPLSATTDYNNFASRRQSRIYRPNYFNPRGINYAPTYSNYIPITRFHHDMNPERGEYNVGFETGNGIMQQESGYIKAVPVYNYRAGRFEEGKANVKTGSVSWTSPEGIPFSYSYTADENGFRPVGAHIPPYHDPTKSTMQTAAFPADFEINTYKPTVPYNPIRVNYG